MQGTEDTPCFEDRQNIEKAFSPREVHADKTVHTMKQKMFLFKQY